MKNQLLQTDFSSPVGTLYLTASAEGLRSVLWTKHKTAPMMNKVKNPAPSQAKHLLEGLQQLREYFEGRRRTFNLDYDLQGTEFQKKVWKGLLAVPYGQTTSYKELAEQVGSPKGFRAVGSANGKNPICILIPCHRVIAANGALGGYSGRGGIKTKKALLSLEDAI